MHGIHQPHGDPSVNKGGLQYRSNREVDEQPPVDKKGKSDPQSSSMRDLQLRSSTDLAVRGAKLAGK